MLLGALLYWLLCMPVTLRACAGINAQESSVQISLGVGAAALQLDALVRLVKGRPALAERYGRKKRERKRRTEGVTRPLLRLMARRGRWRMCRVEAVVGMGDAAASSIAAGALHAALTCAAAAHAIPCRVQTRAGECGLILSGECIFTMRAGDIILTAAQALIQSKRKEGIQCSSIPSRA